MIAAVKCLNEGKTILRTLNHLYESELFEQIVVVDGGSTDETQDVLYWFGKQANIDLRYYVHPWLKWYHDMEVCQSNIVLSYIPLERWMFILDCDERMSDDLVAWLKGFDPDVVDVDCISFSRRSYDLMRYPDAPYAMTDDDGWPMVSNQIGQYPDYQCRLIRRQTGMHWVNSPHHVMFGVREKLFREAFTDCDIIHYHGKEDLRDREIVEKQWLRNKARRTHLGLGVDYFECKTRPELFGYDSPAAWPENG